MRIIVDYDGDGKYTIEITEATRMQAAEVLCTSLVSGDPFDLLDDAVDQYMLNQRKAKK